ASDELRNNEEIVKRALRNDVSAIDYVPIEIAIDYIQKNVCTKYVFLKYMPFHLRNNKRVVRLFVQKDGLELEYASLKLRDDEEIVKLARDNWPNSTFFASERVKNIIL
ncbi:DUF4116 domain-containing protein, partial [bacterium]|nr:DUF4116 domain-containing protein [bacterium]